MKIAAIALAASLLVSCWTTGPTEAQYRSASTVRDAAQAGMPVSEADLAAANDVISAYEAGSDGQNGSWVDVLLWAAGIWLGAPLLGRRGRGVASGGVKALMRGDVRSIARAVPAYLAPSLVRSSPCQPSAPSQGEARREA